MTLPRFLRTVLFVPIVATGIVALAVAVFFWDGDRTLWSGVQDGISYRLSYEGSSFRGQGVLILKWSDARRGDELGRAVVAQGFEYPKHPGLKRASLSADGTRLTLFFLRKDSRRDDPQESAVDVHLPLPRYPGNA